MTTIAILRQLSAGHAAIAAALRQAADEAEAGNTQATTAALGAAPAEEKKPRGRPKATPKVEETPAAEDPLAGLTGGDNTSEPEQAEEVTDVEDNSDPLAGLGLDEPEEPAAPVITREGLAKVLGDFARLVDSVKGKGKGSTALQSLFTKHGAANLKELKEDEFLGVLNEANAVIDAINKMKK